MAFNYRNPFFVHGKRESLKFLSSIQWMRCSMFSARLWIIFSNVFFSLSLFNFNSRIGCLQTSKLPHLSLYILPLFLFCHFSKAIRFLVFKTQSNTSLIDRRVEYEKTEEINKNNNCTKKKKTNVRIGISDHESWNWWEMMNNENSESSFKLKFYVCFAFRWIIIIINAITTFGLTILQTKLSVHVTSNCISFWIAEK